MICRVNENYTSNTNSGDKFFIVGELFECKTIATRPVTNLTPTGTKKDIGWVINPINIDKIADTWDEAREKYPEFFL